MEMEPRGERNWGTKQGFYTEVCYDLKLTFYILSLIQSHCTPFTYRQSYDKVCALEKTTLCPNKDLIFTGSALTLTID